MKNKSFVPERPGYFGEYGGRFVPETLMPVLQELTTAYEVAKLDASFQV